MSAPVIALIVEGEGEVAAAPVLVRRIAYEIEVWDVRIPRPMRVPRGDLTKPGGIEREVERRAMHVAQDVAGGVLVLLDADDDCPAALGPQLLSRAESTCRVPVSVVLASREYESWFIAAAPSLAGRRGFPATMRVPSRPPDEHPRDAKGWLTAQRGRNHPYSPTVDQAALTEALDIGLARKNSDSFDKFCRDLISLLANTNR